VRALHIRLTFTFALLLAALAVGLLLLLSRTSGRYSDEVLQRLNSGIAPYVVRELPLLEGGKVNEAALHELAHRTMTVNPSAEVYLLDPLGRVLSTAIPRNRIRRVSVRLEPISTFLRLPDRRPLYGDDPTSVAARRVFSYAALSASQSGHAELLLPIQTSCRFVYRSADVQRLFSDLAIGTPSAKATATRHRLVVQNAIFWYYGP